MTEYPEVEILMATYNGERYISEQLDSILNQTYNNWHLTVRDDGSSDDTVNILKKYLLIHPEKISIIETNNKNLGPCDNFALLLEKSKADYIMFSDQDDVWLRNKIEISIKKMLEIEATYPNKPIVVHTDLIVADSKLNTISESMLRYHRLYSKISCPLELLLMNNITGCTMCINKKAREISIPIPKNAFMHDLWIGVKTMQKGGKICFIDLPLVKYRQHTSNYAGVEKAETSVYYIHMLKSPIKSFFRFLNGYNKVKEQADLANEKFDICRFMWLKIYILIKRLFYSI
ncbi:MAG: glycosyltransferase family 2 protein [Elusimicrobia bacterium]|nr:glycosyltransferase family 2 protein [Elusimicrobiota bacterium]